jgi:hypothetical protein
MCLPLDAYGATDQHFIPDCAGVITISYARIVRVEQDGTLILADGRAVVLEGVRLPLADGKAVSGQALATLRAMAADGLVNFTTSGSDRYGRIRAQGFGHAWFQTTLLEQGLAQVRISPDRTECAPDLYEAEAMARSRHAGLWTLPDHHVRSVDRLTGTKGSFQLVEGQVGNIGRADGRTFIDFDADAKSHRPFTVVIGAEDRRAFRDFDFDELRGRNIRVRGIVQDYRGRPEIVLSNPAQIELLE